MSEVQRFSKLYGSSPAHLLLALAALVVSAWAVLQAVGQGPPLSLTKWFVGSILAHDLVLLPLYSLVLIGLLRVVGGRGGKDRAGPSPRRLLVLNHLRVPAALSLLLLLLFFPFILGLADAGYEGVSGLSTDPYLPRWLILTGALFLLSGLILAVRLARGGAPAATEPSDSAAAGAGPPPAG
ncbi:MAG: hypothetical protein H0T96_09045 [Thermoleophilaceae bacterium]|nr:hypothetical protein [Thermoleophilaceae bacterium]MDQ3239933.1 hypothetical protein [Actinomycetota bacterium]MDQ3319106.1 hypothetical protein [Actinomycetota bacterium]